MSTVALGRPQGTSSRFTRPVLDMIPVWIELGATPQDIAAALGTTENSLQVMCSKYGISLRRVTDTKLRTALTSVQWGVFQVEAARRGTSVWELISRIVATVADDDLFAAVLDKR